MGEGGSGIDTDTNRDSSQEVSMRETRNVQYVPQYFLDVNQIYNVFVLLEGS